MIIITGLTSGGKVTLDQVSLGIAQSHAPLSIPMLLIPRANLSTTGGSSESNCSWLLPEISVLSPIGAPTVSDHPELLTGFLT